MTSNQFQTELSALVGRALKEGIDAKEMEPTNLVGALHLTTLQVSNMLVVRAQMNQRKAPTIIVPPNGPLSPG